jgi:hypothetical protein
MLSKMSGHMCDMRSLANAFRSIVNWYAFCDGFHALYAMPQAFVKVWSIIVQAFAKCRSFDDF